MGIIEGNSAVARYAAVQKEYQKQQNSQNNAVSNQTGSRTWQPAYQNDVSARHYEIASWLQEMGTLGETSTSDTTGTDATQSAQDGLLSEEALAAEEAVVDEEEETKWPWELDDEVSKKETELERLQKMLERWKEKRAEQKSSARKPLRYKYSRVSSAIRGAKTMMQASNALVKANSSLSQLRRQAASGNYNESEVAMAQTHARKMVRTARMKLRNIKAESNQKNNNTLAKDHANAKMNTAVKRVRAQKKLDVMQQKDREMLKLQKLIQRKEAMFKNKHRRKENWDLMEADMEYLRRRIEYLKNQNENSSTTENPAFAISANETEVFTSADQSGILEGAAAMDAIDPAAAVEAAVETATTGDVL